MPTTDYFADNVDQDAFIGSANWPSCSCFNGKGYVSWQYKDIGGLSQDPYMASYDIDNKIWSDPVWVGDNPLNGDNHGAPAHIVDDDGYIHVAWGSHGPTPMKYKRSTNPEDISSWDTMPNIVYYWCTYPRWLKDKYGRLYLFYRGYEYYHMSHTYSDDGGDTWLVSNGGVGDTTKLDIDLTGFPAIEAIYASAPTYDSVNHRIYVAWSAQAGTYRYNLYAAYLDISHEICLPFSSAEKWYSLDGTDLGATITNAELGNCLVVDTGSYGTGSYLPYIKLDSNNRPHIIYEIKTGASTAYLKHIYWTGVAWSSQYTICAGYWDGSGGWTIGDIIPSSSSNVIAYITNPTTFALEKWSFNGSAWSQVSTINTSSCRHPTIVHNYTNDLRLVFTDATNGRLYALNSLDEYVGKTEQLFMDDVRLVLQDSDGNIWTYAELNKAINDALLLFSKRRPYKQVTTLATTADSRLVDISSLVSELLFGYDVDSFDSVYGVEYPTGQYPRKYRSYNVQPDGYIELSIDTAPTSIANVTVIYHKAHTTITIPQAYESLLVNLAAAIAAKNKPLKYINDWQASTTKFTALTTAIDDMTNRITTAIDDLVDGRTALTADAGTEEMTDRITQAINDIASARTYFNKSNIGQPEIEYLSSAARELNIAMTHLNRSGGFNSLTTGELSIANTSLNKARGYVEHIKLQLATINLAEKYEAWGLNLEASLQKELDACTIRHCQKDWRKS